MSSKYVRDTITTFITTQFPTDNIIPDLAAESEELKYLLEKYGLTSLDSFLAIDYIGSDEIPITLAANNVKGKYREEGSLFIHISFPASSSARNQILNKSEELRNAFRGQRIGDILIDSVTPPNFDAGASLQFQGGFTSAAIIVNYERDLNL